MTRARPETVRLLDELAANATAATTVQLVDGWLLRAAAEYPFRRCNSALPYGGDSVGLEARIGMVEGFYRDRDLPVRFRMSPAALPIGLDELLETRGYEIEEPTLVLVADTARVVDQTEHGDAGHVVLTRGVNMRRVAEYCGVGDGEHGQNRLRQYARMFEHLGLNVATAVLVDQKPSAVGHAVLERRWAGVYAMTTRPDARRRGAATTVLHQLAWWARENDAPRMYLQVEATNDGARQLYTRAGFETAYRYHYRTHA